MYAKRRKTLGCRYPEQIRVTYSQTVRGKGKDSSKATMRQIATSNQLIIKGKAVKRFLVSFK